MKPQPNTCIENGIRQLLREQNIERKGDDLTSKMKQVLEIIPENVFDPIKWIHKNKPELEKDEVVITLLKIATSKQKLPRKRTSTHYVLTLNKDEWDCVRRIIEYYVEEYCGESLDGIGKVLKGFHYNYQYSRADEPITITPCELTCLIKAFLQYVSDYLDMLKDLDSYELEKLKNTIRGFKSIFNKEMTKEVISTIPYVDEEGYLKYRVEKKKETVVLAKMRKLDIPENEEVKQDEG